MVLIQINPTKILTSGDVKQAKTFIGQAKSQMEILKKFMNFQELSQGIRKIWLNQRTYIECKKVYDYQECKIHVIPPNIKKESESLNERCFFIIFATESGNEAVLWDLCKDRPLSPKGATLEEARALILEFDNHEDIEAVCPDTDHHYWDIGPLPDEEDCPLMLPTYVDDSFDMAIGYKWAFTFLYPSIITWDVLGMESSVEWDLNYIGESPLPYPLKKLMGGQEEDAEKASYESVFLARAARDDGLLSTFETMTGCVWPEEPETEIIRFFNFWHPFFWYSLKDTQGIYANLSSYGHGIKINDSWDSKYTEWDNESFSITKQSRVLKTSGIATKTVNKKIESVIFEYVNVCLKKDDFGETMCDASIYDKEEYFRIYEAGKIELDNSRKTILDGTNAYRAAVGTHEIVFNSVLSESAQRHANDMATIADDHPELFGHQGTDGTLPPERITDAGYFRWIDINLWGYLISENCTFNYDSDNPEQTALIDWANSPDHYANMINSDTSEMGIGYAESEHGAHVFVQNFGKIDNRFPGFSPFDTTALKEYVDQNFIFDPIKETSLLPKIYMVGSMELTSEQLQQIQEGE